MKKIILISCLLINCTLLFSQEDSVKLSCTELQKINLVFNEWEHLKLENTELNNLIINKDKQIVNYKQIINNNNQQQKILENNLQLNKALIADMKRKHRKDNILMGITIGGLTISTGTLLYFLLRNNCL